MEDEWDYISDKNRIAGLRDEIKRKSREGMEVLAERDRLAAENARLEALVVAKNESIEVLYAKWSKEIVKRDATNATLDALTNAFPNLDAMHEILYPKETTDDHH